MKRCLSCEHAHESADTTCPACGHTPRCIDGVVTYAPDHALGADGFKPEYFSHLSKLEPANFWFRARNRLILWAMKKYCVQPHSFLEIGCGTGYVLSAIVQQNPDTVATGSELFVDGLNIAAQRVPSATFVQMDARSIPYVEEFDVVGAFDVIEHIKDDELVLAQIYQALGDSGRLILTVPQHKRLWSQADVYACHQRRYSAKELHRKVRAAGFKIERTTSFVTTLMPAMFASRQFGKKQSADRFDSTKELDIPSWLNSIFYLMLSFEIVLIRLGVNFPIGGTRLLVARKQ
ncbi:class I SAM-dependent methyltransferase [Hyphomonas sp.]|uniref:class I SAM-dependent methyltransferase n=1 Tax=Hyphomonas sp. TaxID=87 RepID=UPI003D2D57B0|tara:strand:+ start:19579 stop:20451 length:873 start_codon:yes stop_codon:yes gene_type:complete